MRKNNSVTVIIPAYNEQESIEGVIVSLKKLGQKVEIIVVDDGSTDRTYENALKTGVKVIKHPNNKGYGASLKTGLMNSKGSTICFFDADSQHRAQDLKKILTYTETYDGVIGMRTETSHIPFFRKPGKKILNIVANYLSKQKIPDLNCGLRAFKREVLMKFMNILPDGFSFSTTTTLAMYKGGFSIKYVPVVTKKRIGKSTVKQVKHGFHTILLIFQLIVLFDPLRVFMPTAIFLILSGLTYQIVLIIFKGFHIVGGALLSVLSGIIIFFFGLLADQISAIRREGRK